MLPNCHPNGGRLLHREFGKGGLPGILSPHPAFRAIEGDHCGSPRPVISKGSGCSWACCSTVSRASVGCWVRPSGGSCSTGSTESKEPDLTAVNECKKATDTHFPKEARERGLALLFPPRRIGATRSGHFTTRSGSCQASSRSDFMIMPPKLTTRPRRPHQDRKLGRFPGTHFGPPFIDGIDKPVVRWPHGGVLNVVGGSGAGSSARMTKSTASPASFTMF
jgi:hypothetical protein